jgi:hypothetical protein
MTRPSEREIFAEAAVLARAFGWSLDQVLDLEHADRRAFVSHAGGDVA